MQATNLRSKVSYSGKVLILIEAIDELESSFSGSLLKYWMPKHFQDRIKFIVSVGSHSYQAKEHFQKLGCSFIKVDEFRLLADDIKEKFFERVVCNLSSIQPTLSGLSTCRQTSA